MLRTIAQLAFELPLRGAENIRTQDVRHVNSCYFTMVAVDDARKPVAVPPLRPFSPEEKQRFDGALLRKKLRQELEAEFNAAKLPMM